MQLLVNSLTKKEHWTLSGEGKKWFDAFSQMGLDEDLSFELVGILLGDEKAYDLEKECDAV